MTFLWELLIDVLAKTAVWLVVVGAIAAAIAWVLVAAANAAREEPTDLRKALLFSVIGAVAGASLAHRFGWPDPIEISVWGRPLHLVWLAAGAAIGAGASTAPLPSRISAAEG